MLAGIANAWDEERAISESLSIPMLAHVTEYIDVLYTLQSDPICFFYLTGSYMNNPFSFLFMGYNANQSLPEKIGGIMLRLGAPGTYE